MLLLIPLASDADALFTNSLKLKERTSEDHYAIDLKETEEGGLEELQTHIQIPPKGNN